MKKCEVLNDCVIAIQKGSIVYVNDKQFELARKNLKPISEEKAKATPKVEMETAEMPKKETRKKKVTSEE